MKNPLLLLLLSCSFFSRPSAQTVILNAEQTQRLAQLSRLYGHIKYFHPYLGYRDINWDAAFAATAPRLIDAISEKEQAAVIQQILEVLQDPVTKVVFSGAEENNLVAGSAKDSLQFYFTADSILIVKTNNYYGFDNYVFLLQQLETIKTWARSSKGKTVMLIDERTQSQAEHTGLFFEAANGTEFIGSPTAGANGDVTNFMIPGNISLGFSGHDVRHADGRQLQQLGLQPKILVKPTIKGIRAGRDEVLEAAVKYLTGM